MDLLHRATEIVTSPFLNCPDEVVEGVDVFRRREFRVHVFRWVFLGRLGLLTGTSSRLGRGPIYLGSFPGRLLARLGFGGAAFNVRRLLPGNWCAGGRRDEPRRRQTPHRQAIFSLTSRRGAIQRRWRGRKIQRWARAGTISTNCHAATAGSRAHHFFLRCAWSDSWLGREGSLNYHAGHSV